MINVILYKVFKGNYSRITIAFSSCQWKHGGLLLTSISGVANQHHLQDIEVNLDTFNEKINGILITFAESFIRISNTRMDVQLSRELNEFALSVRMTQRIRNSVTNELINQPWSKINLNSS